MKKRYDKSMYFAKSLLGLAVAAALPVMAQERVALEEIVVTAEHREASLQETQISLAAFDSDAIAELGISNGLDIGEYVPNLNSQPYVGGRTGISYNIRGIGNSETIVTFDPAVSVYIDGVLIAKNTGSLLDVLELERIEVLRGPQGTLYGRNTMGGAVNYITKQPTSEAEGRLKATLGRFNQRDLRGMINVPLLGADSSAGELNLRASIATLNRDGNTDNTGPSGQDELGTKDRDVAMLQMQWLPTDNLSATYSYDRTRIDEIPETPWNVTQNPNTFAGGLLAPFDADEDDRPDSISINDLQTAETEVDGHALTVSWDISDTMTLSSLTGVREMENLGYADSDGSPISIIFTRDEQTFESVSQEFRLVGTALSDRLDYSTGLFFYQEDGTLWNQTDVFGGPFSANIAEFDNEAMAVYGQLTYAITDKLDVTFGIRYTDEDREMEKAAIDGTVSGFDPILSLDEVKASMPAAVFPKASESFTNTSPMVSFSYDWNDDLMTYFKVSTGYQSGGFNARDPRIAFTTGFDEETIRAYEVGIKSTFDNRFQFNAAAFFSDYDDKRVNQFNPETLVSVQVNAGVVEIAGVEMEFLAQINDNFQLGLNYGHVAPEYVEYDSVPDPDTGEVTDLSDTLYFPYAPRNSYSAFLAYENPLDFGVLRARLDYSYRGKMYFLTPKRERNASEDAGLVSARISLDEMAGPGDTRIRVSAWGKNLTDEGYWNFGVNLFNSFGFDINTYGEPRTFGVDLQVDF